MPTITLTKKNKEQDKKVISKPINPVNLEQKEEMSISNMIGSSKRLTLTYIVLVIWLGLAIFAIMENADFYGLAVYFASGLPLIIGYLWSETNRPSLKDASQILRFIRPPRNFGGGGYGDYDNYGGYDNVGGQYNVGGYRNRYNNYDNDINNNKNFNNQSIEISIYSDDSSVELKTNEEKLETLVNTGYVDDNDNGKYTFNKKYLDQVKSLINDKIIDPEI